MPEPIYINTFCLIIIPNKNNHNADISLFRAFFEMEVSAAQPQIKGNRDYPFLRTIYKVPYDLLAHNVRPLSNLQKATIHEWIPSNSAPKNTAISLCF